MIDVSYQFKKKYKNRSEIFHIYKTKLQIIFNFLILT